MKSTFTRSFAAALVLSAVLAAASTAQIVPAPGGTNQPGPLPPPPAPVEPVVLVPLTFDPKLPDTPIAWVDEKPIPASTLLELVLEQNFSTGVAALVMGKIVEIELARAKVEVTEADLEDELKDLLAQVAPGKSLEDVEKSGQTSLKHLKAQARTNRGWKKLFWEAQKVPEDQRTNQTQQLMMQFYMRQAMERYDRRIRGQNPQPKTPGVVAEIVEKESGAEIKVGANEALDFLMGLVKPSGLVEARGEIVDRAVLAKEAEAAGVKVSDDEVATWAAEMRAKYPPPFTWDQIARFKGSTVEREMEKWRRIRVWKKVTGTNPGDAELDAFLKEHKSWFTGKTKKVSHILVRTVDEVTGLPLDEAKQAEAEATIRTLRGKLDEGVDFGWLAETYSDDTVTAKGKGRLAQAIKEWGGGLDRTFQNAAWSLTTVNELSPPVKSAFGWHILRLDEISDPAPKVEPDWKDPRWAEAVREEYESQQMEKYLAERRAKAAVKLAPNSVLFDLKKRDYAK